MIELKNADYKDYLLTIPDESIDCIFTDPPYTDGKSVLKTRNLWLFHRFAKCETVLK